MDKGMDFTAWSATLLGLFSIAVAIGALRKPGQWRHIVAEIEKSPALQLLSAFLELFIGAVIYLLNPWIPDDILATIMKAFGGLMMAEALVVAALSDIYFQIWLKNLAALQRGWPIATFLAGDVLVFVGALRLV